jgi:hypothetical protein
MRAWLDKAAGEGDPAALVEARLVEDMKPLTAQYQFASDSAKNAVARLLGIEPPSMPDTETTFAELQERLRQDHRLPRKRRSRPRSAGARTARSRSSSPTGWATASPAATTCALRAAQLLFPRDHGLRHPARAGRVARQADYLQHLGMPEQL